ncbi:hypothetical protein RCL1_003558 [Eukaryota sp. TZLM3-RCL]
MRRFIVLLFCLVILFALSESRGGKDFYKILGVSRNASKREIKKAFRELSLKYHPDKHENYDKSVEEKFMEIKYAHEVLSDDEKRAIYDRHGEEGLKRQESNQGGGNPFANPFDFFRQHTHQGHHEEERKVADVVVPLAVTLDQLYTGHSLRITVARQVVCSSCSGSGAKSPSDIDKCQYCNGQGVRVVKQQLGPGFFTQSSMPCDKCGGKGTQIKKKCNTCKGKKLHRSDETVTIDVEAGMQDGDVIELDGYTDEHPDISSGNIKFIVKTVPHQNYTREGNNLYTRMHVNLVEALCGFSKKFIALDGHVITVERSQVTSPGQVLRIRNEGMPSRGFGSSRGDLFVTVDIDFPKSSLSNSDKDQIQSILSKYL